MKLTKLQRYSAYCIMLQEAEKPSMYYEGLCKLARVIFSADSKWNYRPHLETLCDYSGVLGLLPELNKYQSSDGSTYWFSNWSQRKGALIEAIKETHPDL